MKTIEELAREAGMVSETNCFGDPLWKALPEELARFGAVFRVMALEEAARACDQRAAQYDDDAALAEGRPDACPEDWRFRVYAKHVRRAAQDIRKLKGNP